MGARQSKRSVDITTTPKKEGIPAEGGGVVGDAAAPGDGKLERIEESDAKPTTNGIAPHTEVNDDKDKDKDEASEKEKENEKEKQQSEEVKAEETKQESSGESPAETAEVTTPTEANPASPNAVTSPDSKETKKKDKMKKKWSFRSISFSRKDKSKPARDEAPKNGDVTKEETLAEGGEEAENAVGGSPTEEENSTLSSPSENENSPTAELAAVEAKEEVTTVAASSPLEEKKEEPTPSAPTPVPVEDKKEEIEKVEPEKKVVEVSEDGGHSVTEPIEVSVFRVQPVDTPSIIERKTSEDLPSFLPSSPPPTPIDPSPLQQAQQAAAAATVLARALELPAEAAADNDLANPSSSLLDDYENDNQPQDQIAPAIPQSSEPKECSNALNESSSVAVSPTAIEQLPCEAMIRPEIESVPVESDVACHPPSSNNFQDKSEEQPSSDEKESIFVVQESMESVLVSEKEAPLELKQKELVVEATPEPATEQLIELISENVQETTIFKETSKVVTSVDVPEIAMKELPKMAAEKMPEVKPETTLNIEFKNDKEFFNELTNKDEVVAKTTEKLIEKVAEPREDPAKKDVETIASKEEEPPTSPKDLIVDSEEGPVPVTQQEMLVEAKPAFVIPEEEVPEVEVTKDYKATREDAQEENMESMMIIPDSKERENSRFKADDVSLEDKIEEKKEAEVCSLGTQSINESSVVAEKMAEAQKEITETAEIEDEELPPPVPDSPPPMIKEERSMTIEPETIVVASSTEKTKEADDEIDRRPLSQKERLVMLEIADTDVPIKTHSPTSSRVPDVTTCPLREKDDIKPVSEPPLDLLSRLENVSVASSDQCVSPSFEHPLPAQELVCPLPPRNNESEMTNELPDPVEVATCTMNPTETLPMPPSPSPPQSFISITSGITTATNDCSKTLLHDDQSDREFKTESLTRSLDSYYDSEVELKERLAESLTETENQEETLSCQLLNEAMPTAFQENHQSTPENEAPVEKSMPREMSTTESVDEAPKVAPPAVPIEIPASPPSVPAITEDVASVTKAIEEIDISDKAVAAAVNEIIECNTNEIIADAHHQNDMNE